MSAESQAINKKIAELKEAKFDLGAPLSNIIDAESGGYYRRFDNATVYWHPQVGSGAHEVHGNILAKYVALGQFSKHPKSGTRLLGYPLTDESDSADLRCRVSGFEWGAIYSLNGGTALWGKLYDAYKLAGGERGRLGYPIADPAKRSDGEIAFFEFGCLWYGTKSNGKVIEFGWKLPQLGQPWMLDASDLAGKTIGTVTTSLDPVAATSLFGILFANTFRLVETGGSVVTPFNVQLKALGGASSLGVHVYAVQIAGGFEASLKNRTLYDICVNHASGAPFAIAAHALYLRKDWKDFQFIQVTDTHLSRRLDGFRDIFRTAQAPKGVKYFNNFNDSFRLFVQYANQMHDQGDLDFILLTGDIVDYVFEDGKKSYRNNNFAFFEELVTGKAAGSDEGTAKIEVLRVPIFTSLGNHDYRTVPYYPIANVHAKVGDLLSGAVDTALLKVRQRLAKLGVPGEVLGKLVSVIVKLPQAAIEAIGDAIDTVGDWIFGGSDDSASFTVYTHAQYGAMNLLKSEAVIASGSHINIFADRALAMVNPDEDNRSHNLDYYFRHINRDQSFTIALDNHRIVVIDGKWDSDPIDTLAEGFAYKLAAEKIPVAGDDVSEDALTFGGRGSPNTVGFDQPELDKVREALTHDGLVIIGVHCPSITPPDGECPYFLRESLRNTFHRSFEPEMMRYFQRRTVTTAEWSTGKTPHFAKGRGDNLDYGVMRKLNGDFMRLVAGASGTKAADLVLAGHTHINWESRIKWNAESKDFAMYTDFYTENPTTYYHTGNNTGAVAESIHITVADDASPSLPVTKDGRGWMFLATPPNAHSLDKQPRSDTAISKWWKEHRPLMIQTEALGPIKSQRGGANAEPQPDLRGCRHVTVTNNLIQRVHSVTLPEMSKVSATHKPETPGVNPIKQN